VDIKKQISERIQTVIAFMRIRAASMSGPTLKVSRRPQRGTSKSTSWDRHRPNHYRASVVVGRRGA
jgi:hypothetical protein